MAVAEPMGTLAPAATANGVVASTLNACLSTVFV